MFHKSIQYVLEKLGKSKSGFERTVVSKFKKKRRVGSGNELVDYSRAPCLGADQKARGLWERDWYWQSWITTAHAYGWWMNNRKRAFKTNMAARSSVLSTAFFRFGKVLVRWTTLEGSCLVLSLACVLNARMKFMLMIVNARLKDEWIREICSKSRYLTAADWHRSNRLGIPVTY